MEAPLVNEYKQAFIWRRLLHTLLGGLRLALPHAQQPYIYIIQVSLIPFLQLSLVIYLYNTIIRQKALAIYLTYF